MAPAPKKKKAIKIGRALKRLPARAVGRGNSAGAFAPIPGEQPIVILRVQVLSGTNLLAKDRNGSSDPYVPSLHNSPAVHVPTPVSEGAPPDACLEAHCQPDVQFQGRDLDFPIYLSLADKLGVVELVVWDKDMLKKDYLGEAWIPIEDWSRDGNAFAFDDMKNKNLVSTRNSTPATGGVQVKLGFVVPPNTAALMDFAEIYSELVKRTRPSLVSAPPLASQAEGTGWLPMSQSSSTVQVLHRWSIASSSEGYERPQQPRLSLSHSAGDGVPARGTQLEQERLRKLLSPGVVEALSGFLCNDSIPILTKLRSVVIFKPEADDVNNEIFSGVEYTFRHFLVDRARCRDDFHVDPGLAHAGIAVD
ncbi:hypothetical protein L226DRAFT_524683 [Lentinus tigrinus ALCF2SS1-7]|uniref:uncharacterized protein n=1 Tax=Lentinus tigrinus ALCF2SS1-7 TaxID=1328758 RepID=UPI001166022C|nr:hypothetical protein L226DRAFT_524683 [Lentinus tigrinus ALCF2SS1-7]